MHEGPSYWGPPLLHDVIECEHVTANVHYREHVLVNVCHHDYMSPPSWNGSVCSLAGRLSALLLRSERTRLGEDIGRFVVLHKVLGVDDVVLLNPTKGGQQRELVHKELEGSHT